MISGAWLQKALLVQYIIIAIVYLFEGNKPKALYWISAGLLTISILWMK